MSLLQVNPGTAENFSDAADRNIFAQDIQIKIDNGESRPPSIQITKEETTFEATSNESTAEPVETEEIHNVSIVVTICAAFPAEDAKEMIQDSSNKPRATEGPKPQNFYKFEYHLMPDDPEPIQTDVVTYKVAAKLFAEKSEPKIVKSWEHENKIWIVWSQTHDLQLTRSRLLKLFDHEIVLKIWDSRDFCSARTKFDKPKPFKFSKTGDQLEENVKRMVIENCDQYLKQIPKELQSRIDRKLPNQARIDTPVAQHLTETSEKMTTNTLVAVPLKSATTSKNGNKLAELALDTDMIKSVKHLRNSEKKRPKSKSLTSRKQTESMSQFDLETARSTKRQSKGREKTKKEMAAEMDFIKKNGIARIKLKMKILFSGESYLGARIVEPVSTIEDCIVCVNLENSLMSDNQLYDLNPLTIKVEKLTNMPKKPISYAELKETCMPVYCSYAFFKQPMYRTDGILQEKNIFYHDINVFLLGLLDKQELHEFLHSAPFEIEIHDRDRRPITKEQLKACVFGNDPSDENISSINNTATKYTVQNPFNSKIKSWDPYGIARLNLYDLVMGKKLIEFFVPVLPCTAPDVLGRNAIKNTSQNSRKLDGGDNAPMQAGAFLDFNTHLNVKITTAKPVFHQKVQSDMKEEADSTNSCAFGRIVIKLDKSKKTTAITLKSAVKQINAQALGFDKYPLQVQEAAMSTHKLNLEQQTSKTLNLITGFHLISGQSHLFVLEGLKDLGIQRIYDMIPRKQDDPSADVIYNSELSFSQRLYANLDVELFTVKLFEPLEDIVKKPLLYIRDMTPKASFDALVKINQLLNEYKLRSIIRCDLLPTSEMIQSMSKEFGVPFTTVDDDLFKSGSSIADKQNTIDTVSEMNGMNENMGEYGYEKVHNIPHTSRVWTPLDNDNDQYLRDKLERDVPNFVMGNIHNIQEASEYNKYNKPIKNYIIADNFSYSNQTKNSTEIALNEFRSYVKQTDPKQQYSFNPESEYSTTFVPVNIKKEEALVKQKSLEKWRSAEGWIFPDVKTTMQCNQHNKKPHQASIDDLYQPWEENALNFNKLRSPCERRFFKGVMRDKDFDVWKKPNDKSDLPITIFEAGAIKKRLEREHLADEQKKWRNKLIVDNTDMKFHKISAATENKIDGAGAQNQIDKLRGALKSEPIKKSLLVGGVNFNNIPALSVIKTSYDDQENFFHPSKGFIAGDSMRLRITDDSNKIPVINYNHANFERIKGRDFDLSKQPHTMLYKRKIVDSLKNSHDLSPFNERRTQYIIPKTSPI